MSPPYGYSVMVSVFAELFLAAAAGLQPRPQPRFPPVLGLHPNRRFVRTATDVGRVGEQTLLAASHLQDELGNWGVGHRPERRADTAVLGVDAANEVDLELTAQFGHQVGQ